MERPIIFVAGRPILRPRTGLEMRTRLMFDVLTRIGATRPRWLFVPASTTKDLSEYQDLGWKVIPVPSEGADTASKLRRLGSLMTAKLRGDPHAEILRIRGGSAAVPRASLGKLLRSSPTALVWLYRADYFGLLKWRSPKQRWVVDTNDSLVHLQDAYGWNCTTHRLLWWKRNGLRTALVGGERRWARWADLVIAISPKDHRYFGGFLPEHRLTLFDTCVEKTSVSEKGSRPIKIGFLGSAHQGSIDSTRMLGKLITQGILKGSEVAIAGGCTEHLSPDFPQVTNMGRVENSSSFWAATEATVLPLAQPTGISVKLQEAVVHGCRVFYPRGSPTWSKAREGVHVFAFSDHAELGRLLTSEWPEIPSSSFDCMLPSAVDTEVQALLEGMEKTSEIAGAAAIPISS